MITFTRLGTYGRLGNQLFEIAATIGAAFHNGDDFGFPRWKYEQRFNLSGCFHDHLRANQFELYEEPSFRYAPIPVRRNLNLLGRFQSEKYFDHCKHFIRSAFAPDIAKLERCFIHVRRGDYLSKPNSHPVLPISYFRKAMEILPSDHYIVFSDDIDWCKSQFKGSQFEFSEEKDEVRDLFMMSACSGAIISNSSFSWWGAWLGCHDNVVCPKDWFGPANRAYGQTGDLIPERWISI